MEKRYQVILLMVAIIVSAMSLPLMAQEQKRIYVPKRWQLEFKYEDPRPIIIEDPSGAQSEYWYMKYQVTNHSGQRRSYFIDIRIVIDKPKEGIEQRKIKGGFYQAQIPEDVDKKQFIDYLMCYYDTKFPVVKRKILQKLGLKEKLSVAEKTALAALRPNRPQSVEQVASASGLSYEVTANVLNDLTVKGLALSQAKEGTPTFVRTEEGKAIFLIGSQEVTKKVGDPVGEWEIVAIKKESVVVKKGERVVSFGPALPLDLLYSRSTKKVDDTGEHYYITGTYSKGVYQGRTPDGKPTRFSPFWINNEETKYGLAVFPQISREMDFMAVLVSGLVDPIVNYKGVVYAEDKVLAIGYSRLGDEVKTDMDKIKKLYERWVVLSLKRVRGKRIH